MAASKEEILAFLKDKLDPADFALAMGHLSGLLDISKVKSNPNEPLPGETKQAMDARLRRRSLADPAATESFAERFPEAVAVRQV
jgi:hypothetical protein